MMARKLYRFTGLLMVVGDRARPRPLARLRRRQGAGQLLAARQARARGRRDRLPPCLPLAAAQVRGVRQRAQRALVPRLQRERGRCCSRDRRPGGRQAVLNEARRSCVAAPRGGAPWAARRALMPRHRSSAVPLAWLYAALIVYASLYPFAGWRVPGVGPLDFLVAPLAALAGPGSTSISNLLGYLPLGFLLFVALAAQRPLAPAAAALIALLGGALLSFDARGAAELPAAARLLDRRPRPQRARHRARRRASARCCTGRGGIERWQMLRDRWFVARSAGGLALLLLWPIGLLFPTAVPFGLGQVLGRVQPVLAELLAGHAGRAAGPRGWADAAASARRERDDAVGGERAVDHRPRPARALPGRLHDRRAGLAAHRAGHRRGARSASPRPRSRPRSTSARSTRFAWTTAQAIQGVLVGLAAAALLSLVPRRVAAGFGLIALTALVMLVAQAPADPYFAQSLQGLGAGALHPLPRRGAVGRLGLAVRRALLPAGAAGGARAESLTTMRRLSRRGRAGCRARRWVREPLLGQLAQHAHVMSPGHRLADRHRGGPHAAAMRAFWRRNSSLSSPPTSANSGRFGAGRATGLRRAAAAASRCRSGARKGAWRSGSSSNTPESDERALAPGRPAGRERRAGQSVASIIAARWPPAECPATTMRFRVAAVLGGVAPDPGQRRPLLAHDLLDARRRAERVVRHARPSRRRRRRAARRRRRRACRGRASSRRGCRPAPARRGARGREEVEPLAAGRCRRRCRACAGRRGAGRGRSVGPLAAGSAGARECGRGCCIARRTIPASVRGVAAAPADGVTARSCACRAVGDRLPSRPARPAAWARRPRRGGVAQRRVDQRVGHPQRDALDLAVGQAPDVLQHHVRLDAVDDRQRAVQPVAHRGRQLSGASGASACSRMRTRWPRR